MTATLENVAVGDAVMVMAVGGWVNRYRRGDVAKVHKQYVVLADGSEWRKVDGRPRGETYVRERVQPWDATLASEIDAEHAMYADRKFVRDAVVSSTSYFTADQWKRLRAICEEKRE